MKNLSGEETMIGFNQAPQFFSSSTSPIRQVNTLPSNPETNLSTTGRESLLSPSDRKLFPSGTHRAFLHKSAKRRNVIIHMVWSIWGTVLPFELFTTTQWRTEQSTRTDGINKITRESNTLVQSIHSQTEDQDSEEMVTQGVDLPSGRLGRVFTERDSEDIIISEQLRETAVIGNESGQNANATTSLANGVVV